MRIGFVQMCPALGDVERNLANIEHLVNSADAPDLLVLPELATSGYQIGPRERALELAEPLDGPSIDRLSALATKRDCALVVGFAERDGERLFNSAALLGPSGERSVMRKGHLFWNEKDLFDPGDLPYLPVTAAGASIGTLVCFDWAFPEAARSLCLGGADILAHSANLVLPFAHKVMPVRCLENRVFGVLANRYGEEPDAMGPIRFSGRSLVLDTQGEILVEAPTDRDDVQVVDIDLDQSRSKRITPRNHAFEDRHPELYRLR